MMSTSSLRAQFSVHVDAAIKFLMRLMGLAAHSGMPPQAEQPPPAPVAGSPAQRSHWVDRVRLSAPR
ncbi:MAG TPA: hypothetical protein VF783_11685 [Terriglobales bacterium]